MDINNNEIENNILEDVLLSLDLLSNDNLEDILQEEIVEENTVVIEKNLNTFEKTKVYILFVFKYIFTSSTIFGILMLTTNYSAYTNIAKSYLFSGELNNNKNMLINSVQASYIEEDNNNSDRVQTGTKEIAEIPFHSISSLTKTQNKEEVNLKIDITPYENRIIIPKIGKNVPLVEIENKNVSGERELNNIFMNELQKGVVRYPGSEKPGQEGNTFIFGHSSNFPWIKGDYNDVFSLLDNVDYNDDIIVYYGQKKFTYKIREKKVINPGDVSVLKSDKGKSEITVMTCWPIGTTLNRLVLVGDLVKE